MVDVGASLIRIIDVDEKNQILTLMLWLEMKWVDSKVCSALSVLESYINLASMGPSALRWN